MSSCHNEVLAVACADPRVQMEGPLRRLQECLDPPSREVVDNTIEHLVEIGACEQRSGNRGSATFMGSFLFLSAKNDPDGEVEPTDYGKLSNVPTSIALANLSA
jgi:hypothetical protein